MSIYVIRFKSDKITSTNPKLGFEFKLKRALGTEVCYLNFGVKNLSHLRVHFLTVFYPLVRRG